MTTTTTLTLNQDALAEAAGDAALTAVLRGKPATDDVPTAVWWLVAEALRTSVTLRRAATLPSRHDEDLEVLQAEAQLLTDAALDELADATGTRPVPVLIEPPSPRALMAEFQRSILRLARLLVTQRATPAQTLADVLSGHHRALAAVRIGGPLSAIPQVG